MAYLRVVAGCFKGCFMGGSVRVIEDILLSEYGGNAGSSNDNRASHLYRTGNGKGREMAYKKVRVSVKM